MADKKITELNNATLPLVGTELIPIVQGVETKKVPVSEIKDNTADHYRGLWNASTNTPTLTNGFGQVGDWYEVSVAGGGYLVGDIVAYDGSVYYKKVNNNQTPDISGKLDKVTSTGVERVYTINPDGTQGTKAVSELLPPFDIIKNYPNQIVISASGSGFTNIGTYAQTITGNGTDVIYGGGGLAYRKITSTTTANSASNIYDGGVFRITGTKAFYYRCRIKNDDPTNIPNAKFSYGLSGTAIMGSNNPSSYGSALLSFGADNTDSNCQIFYKLASASATKINLGASFPKSQTDEYIIEFWRGEGSTTINYKITNLTTSAVAQGSFVFAFSGLALGIFRNNDTATTAVAIAIRRIELYIND